MGVCLVLVPSGGSLVMRWLEDGVIELIANRNAEQLARHFPTAREGGGLTEPRFENPRLVDLRRAQRRAGRPRPCEVDRAITERIELLEQRVEQRADQLDVFECGEIRNRQKAVARELLVRYVRSATGGNRCKPSRHTGKPADRKLTDANLSHVSNPLDETRGTRRPVCLC